MGNKNSTKQKPVQKQKQEKPKPQQEQNPGISPIIKAKSLLSNGDKAGAFAVLKKAAESGNVMACYDVGFMMIQGIGCDKNIEGGLKLMETGRNYEGCENDSSWKSDGSATEIFDPQTLDFYNLFFVFHHLIG